MLKYITHFEQHKFHAQLRLFIIFFFFYENLPFFFAKLEIPKLFGPSWAKSYKNFRAQTVAEQDNSSAQKYRREQFHLKIAGSYPVGKGRKLVSFFLIHHTSNVNDILLEKQLLLGDETPLKLIMDVVTRWNSTYSMLERINNSSHCQ